MTDRLKPDERTPNLYVFSGNTPDLFLNLAEINSRRLPKTHKFEEPDINQAVENSRKNITVLNQKRSSWLELRNRVAGIVMQSYGRVLSIPEELTESKIFFPAPHYSDGFIFNGLPLSSRRLSIFDRDELQLLGVEINVNSPGNSMAADIQSCIRLRSRLGERIKYRIIEQYRQIKNSLMERNGLTVLSGEEYAGLIRQYIVQSAGSLGK